MLDRQRAGRFPNFVVDLVADFAGETAKAERGILVGNLRAPARLNGKRGGGIWFDTLGISGCVVVTINAFLIDPWTSLTTF